MGRSIFTQPSPEGPTATPAKISKTTAGIRTAGTRPIRSGADTAMTATTSNPPKETSGTVRFRRSLHPLPHVDLEIDPL